MLKWFSRPDGSDADNWDRVACVESYRTPLLDDRGEAVQLRRSSRASNKGEEGRRKASQVLNMHAISWGIMRQRNFSVGADDQLGQELVRQRVKVVTVKLALLA